MSHRARERTPADRDHCGWHKIVIIAAGTMRPISFATPFWTLGTVSEIATGIDQIELQCRRHFGRGVPALLLVLDQLVPIEALLFSHRPLFDGRRRRFFGGE